MKPNILHEKNIKRRVALANCSAHADPTTPCHPAAIHEHKLEPDRSQANVVLLCSTRDMLTESNNLMGNRIIHNNKI